MSTSQTSQTSHILTHLNPIQQAVVRFDGGPLLVLAGAGSGKTRALTHRTAYLIKERNIPPENILLLTFTNKAAEEMKTRIQKLLDSTVNLPFAGTFHSFCARILRINGKHINIPPNYLIYDEKDQLETIKLAMAKIDISTKDFKPTSILATISQAKNELITALEYPQYAQGNFQTTVARVYLTYQRLLKEYQALDFDDLLLETVKLFQQEKDVLNRYQGHFRYILIDEYQDTNQAQYLLTRQLAGKGHNLCVVGDASQSIYAWRGANYHNLMNLKKDFSDLKTINLEQNYRSTQTILKAANEVIKKNTTHPVLRLWTDKKGGKPITLYQANSEIDEANLIVNKIIQGGELFSSFAVLYRTNAQSRIIEEVLLHAGIPYILVGGTRFYERKEIKDCLAYLRLIANPQDSVSRQRVEKIGRGRWKKFLKLTRRLSDYETKELTTLELLDQILEETGYLESFNPKREEDLARLENIKELRSVASQFPNLNQFLENITLIQREYLPQNRSLPTSSARGAVTLMTTHAAKGTEFPNIFMVGMEEGLFPHSRSMMEKDEVEEERRLCYVGMTRAKEKLYLSYAQRRFYFGRYSSNPLSRFIKDIPRELIRFENNANLCED